MRLTIEVKMLKDNVKFCTATNLLCPVFYTLTANVI